MPAAGAARVTAVVPYFGYARQDCRTAAGQALGSTVVADAIAAAGADRLVVVDPHTPGLEAQCRIPVETLTAVPALSHELAAELPDGAVAPDLGAVKLAELYAAVLHVRLRSCASIAKAARPSAHWTLPARYAAVRQ
jgi:ribose-phosphate pyrophosphokinase